MKSNDLEPKYNSQNNKPPLKINNSMNSHYGVSRQVTNNLIYNSRTKCVLGKARIRKRLLEG